MMFNVGQDLSWRPPRFACGKLPGRVLAYALLAIFASAPLHAHEIRPALLDIKEREPGFFDVQWKVPALGDMSLPIKPVFPDCMKPVGPPSAHAAPGSN